MLGALSFTTPLDPCRSRCIAGDLAFVARDAAGAEANAISGVYDPASTDDLRTNSRPNAMVAVAVAVVIGGNRNCRPGGPILNAPAPTPGAGPLILVVDDSWAAAQRWTARRDAIREAAAEAAQSQRSVYLTTTAPQNQPAPWAPITPEQARAAAEDLTPQPFAADRTLLLDRLDALDPFLEGAPNAEIFWLSDGVASDDDRNLTQALAKRGALTVLIDRNAPKFSSATWVRKKPGSVFRIEQLEAVNEWEGAVIASARDGRELIRIPFDFATGERTRDVILDLPLALRNELAIVRLEMRHRPAQRSWLTPATAAL